MNCCTRTQLWMSWHKSTEPYQFTLIWRMEKLTILPTWKCREKSASTWGWIFSFGFPFWDGQYWPWYWVWVVIRGFVLNPWIFILVKLTLRQVQRFTINYWVEMIYLKLYMGLLIGKCLNNRSFLRQYLLLLVDFCQDID